MRIPQFSIATLVGLTGVAGVFVSLFSGGVQQAFFTSIGFLVVVCVYLAVHGSNPNANYENVFCFFALLFLMMSTLLGLMYLAL